MADYSGQILNDRYLVETRIGKGGMGVVYRGRHIIIGRAAAVKFLHPEYAADENTVARFFREAQAAAAVRHENIVEIYDVGLSTDNVPYLVMEYLEGESLATLLRRTGPLDPAPLLTIMDPVLAAAASAHRRGVIHRDLKPENIFITDATDESPSTIKLIDFGISRILGEATDIRLTVANTMIGTPAYMAPEQISNAQSADHLSDIYSLGVVLFEALSGRLPYEGNTPNEVIAKILTQPPPSPSDLLPDIPTALAAVAERAMRRDPSERYPNTEEMREALRAACASEERPVAFVELPLEAEPSPREPSRRRIAVLAAYGTVVIAAAAVAIFMLVHTMQRPDSAELPDTPVPVAEQTIDAQSREASRKEEPDSDPVAPSTVVPSTASLTPDTASSDAKRMDTEPSKPHRTKTAPKRRRTFQHGKGGSQIVETFE